MKKLKTMETKKKLFIFTLSYYFRSRETSGRVKEEVVATSVEEAIKCLPAYAKRVKVLKVTDNLYE